MLNTTTRVGVYCCDDSCSPNFGPTLMALNQYAVRNEWKENLDIEEYGECWPMSGVCDEDGEVARPLLGVLSSDVAKGKIDILVMEDLNVLARSPKALLKLLQVCVERQVPIHVLGPQPRLEQE